jgi:hypothetical protein
MPTTYTAAFTIPSTTTGGKLSGGFAGTPVLQSGDSIVVTVTYPAANGPTLNGYLVFSNAQAAQPNQTTASPFLLTNNNVMCLVPAFFSSPVSSNGQTLYTSQTIPYVGRRGGKYELTFVVMDGTRQWSEDPEFDTSN